MAKTNGGDRFGKAMSDLAAKLKKGEVKVGFLEAATYPNGANVPTVAAIQEFGAPRRGIPPRPYFRNMIAAKKAEWPAAIKAQLKETNYNVTLTLARVGEGISGQLRESIINTNEPPLSEVTLMLRQMFPIGSEGVQSYKDVQIARARVESGERAQGVSTKPLVWTGQMLNSISYEVETG